MRLHHVIAALVLTLTGCRSTAPESASLQRMEFREPHMGTLFTITLYAATEEQGRAAARAGFDRVKELNSKLSDYDADSELMKLCEGPHGVPIRISDDLFTMLERSQELARESDGAFDVTIGPFTRLWRQSRRSKTLPTPEAIAEARKSIGWQKLQLNRERRTATLLVSGMRLDLGGIAKGYAADEALKVLRRQGCPIALVAASGDLAIGDAPPGRKGWNVAIASVDSAGKATMLTLVLKHKGVSTSGDTEQFVEIAGKRYSHIVDKATGLGQTESLGVTVIGPDATTSDGLDTTVNLLGLDRGRKFIESKVGSEALVIARERDRVFPYTTSGFARFLKE